MSSVIPFTAAMAIGPSLLLMWYFHSRDAYPEPPRVLWTTFGLGLLITLPVLVFALPALLVLRAVENPYLAGFGSAFLSAAIPEEAFKFLVLYFYCTKHREFNEPMDGVVYGVAASLGFATLENVLYVSSGGLGLAILRAVTAVPGHAFTGAIMGYYVGRARFEPAARRDLLWAGFAIPTLLHGLYDWPLLTIQSLSRQGGGLPESQAGMGLLCMGFALAVLVVEGVWAIRAARELRRRQERTLIGLPAVARTGGVRESLEPSWTGAAGIGASPAADEKHPNPALGWFFILGGGLLSCGGALLTLLGVLGALLSPGGREAGLNILAGTCLLGVLPLAGGLVMFCVGIRKLNARPSPPPLPR